MTSIKYKIRKKENTKKQSIGGTRLNERRSRYTYETNNEPRERRAER